MTAPPANSLEIDVVRSALKKQYEILEELGRGGMAIVYRARELALEREVAIKVLPAVMTFDAEFVERFQREARTAGQLEHPNIVPIYRVGRTGRIIFFVMKLLRGQSLAAVLRQRGKLTVDEVRHILLDTAAALGYAAKRGVVHRDIKPDNILLDMDGRCVVTDFGIAKTPSGPQTAAGTSMGTPRYMSPEHAQGVPVDGRSDIYSLGVVAYQCLVGSTPFDGEDPFAVLYKHINAPVPRPELATDEEKTLYAVIERMLAKSPEDRFQDANELIVALGGQISQPTLVAATMPKRISRLTPTQIIVTPLTTRLWHYVPKRWRWWTVAAGVVLVFSGAYYALSATRATASDAAGDAESGTTVPGQPAAPAAALLTALPPAVVMAARPVRVAPEPFSRCPAAPRTLALLVDSIRTQKRGAKFTLNYDVCGLEKGAPYRTWIQLRKVNQARFRRIVGATMKPVEWDFPDAANSPRTRRQRSVDLAGMSPGTYAIDVAVIDAKQRRKDRSRQFDVLEK